MFSSSSFCVCVCNIDVLFVVDVLFNVGFCCSCFTFLFIYLFLFFCCFYSVLLPRNHIINETPIPIHTPFILLNFTHSLLTPHPLFSLYISACLVMHSVTYFFTNKYICRLIFFFNICASQAS
jgi:hypothetical protein